MRNEVYPRDYKSVLSVIETQRAIKIIKDNFPEKLAGALNLDRVSAPLFVAADSGINDDLNGIERKVHFTIKEIGDKKAEVVQSLAKWKRMALHKYGYTAGSGIYTDMNAIRRDDDVDNLHSIFVDQWDWEAVIERDQRNEVFLKETVKKIIGAVADTLDIVKSEYPGITEEIERNVFFITTQELEDMYPGLSPKERENAIVKEHKTVFLMQIGDILSSGEKHDGRAPDYDDWTLNGDILIWNKVLGCAFEISSMGIRVDENSIVEQLEKCDATERLKFDYHKKIANSVYPLTIGGGIGQSRLCMLLLEKAHVGEVHVSVWPEDMLEKCRENNIHLL